MSSPHLSPPSSRHPTTPALPFIREQYLALYHTWHVTSPHVSRACMAQLCHAAPPTLATHPPSEAHRVHTRIDTHHAHPGHHRVQALYVFFRSCFVSFQWSWKQYRREKERRGQARRGGAGRGGRRQRCNVSLPACPQGAQRSTVCVNGYAWLIMRGRTGVCVCANLHKQKSTGTRGNHEPATASQNGLCSSLAQWPSSLWSRAYSQRAEAPPLLLAPIASRRASERKIESE